MPNNSNGELLLALKNLEKDNSILKRKIKAEQEKRREAEFQLRERNKELNCLYQISALMTNPEYTSGEVIQKITEVIPGSWQFPEKTAAAVFLQDKIFKTKGFRDTEWKQREAVFFHGEAVGEVVVVLLEEASGNNSRAFLPGEEKLLKVISERIGSFVEKKQNEEKALETSMYYEAFMNASPDALTVTDVEGNIEYSSPASLRLFGFNSEKEFQGKNILDFIVDEDRPKALAELEKMFQDDVEGLDDYRGQKADGTIIDIEVNGEFIRDKKGQPLKMVFITRDITLRKTLNYELVESEKKLKHLMGNLPGIAYRCLNNRDWTMQFMSQGCEQLTGYQPRVFTGEHPRSFRDIIHPEDREKVRKALADGIQNNRPFQVNYRITTATGKEKYVWEKGREIYRNGKPVYLEGLIIDITDQKLAEIELQESEERYKSLFRDNQSVILILDADDGRIVDVNKAACEYYGWSYGELTRKNIREINQLPEEDLTREMDHAKKEKRKHFFFRHQLASGEVRDVEVFAGPIEIGGKTNLYSMVHDITDRKKQELEILKLSHALEQSPVSVIITDLEGTIEFVNSAFTQITGYSAEEAIGQNPRMLKSGQTDPAVYEGLWQTLLNGNSWRGEWINKKKNGAFYWEDAAISPIFNEGKMVNFLAVKQDITERKAIEKKIKELNQNLEQKIEERTRDLEFKTQELEKFFSVSPDLLSITDENGNFLKVNKAWEELLGYSSRELEKSNFADFIHPDDFAPAYKAMKAMENQEEIRNFTNRYKTRSGEYRYIEWHSVAMDGIIYSAAHDFSDRQLKENIEQELFEISVQLTGVSHSEIANAVNNALARLGKFLEADRTYIFELNKGKTLMSNTFEWCGEGISAQIDHLKNLPVSIFPEWMGTLEKHQNVVIPDVKKLPDSWKAEREILEMQEIQSVLVIPMFIENELQGFMGLDSVKRKRAYIPFEINTLNIWGNILMSLINRKNAGEIIEQTRRNYETLFNTINDFIFVLDMEGNIIHVNNSVRERLGYSNGELFGQPVLMVHPEERREEAGEIVSEMMRGNADACQVPLITKAGGYLPVETRVTTGSWDGKPAIFGVSKDISALVFSEQKFSRAFQANASMMLIINMERKEILDANAIFLETFGFFREELIGQNYEKFRSLVSADHDERFLTRLGNNQPVREEEIELKTMDGREKTLLFSADPLYIGKERCALVVMIDLTQRKQMEEELISAKMEADKANKAKSEFLSRMSHELRTPMNSILGFAQLLRMGELNQRQARGVKHIMNSGKHLLDLINEVLDISRIEAGRLSISIESVKFSEILAELFDLIHPMAEKRKINVELKDSPAMKMCVKADRQRLKQVLLNILDNAVKYNKDGGSIYVAASLLKNGRNDFIRIEITDTGEGISKENIKNLFIPFERAGMENSEVEGSGLGLTVVQKLTKIMGGKLGVESQKGLGSKFWVELPAAQSRMDVLENAGKSASKKNGNRVISDGTILYVEDNQSNIELIEQILEEHFPGMNLFTTILGSQAMRLVKKYSPDLILLDLNLPDIHGSEVLKQLKSDAASKNIPVIVISADAIPNQISRMIEAGATDYIPKPLDIELFLKAMDKIFHDR